MAARAYAIIRNTHTLDLVAGLCNDPLRDLFQCIVKIFDAVTSDTDKIDVWSLVGIIVNAAVSSLAYLLNEPALDQCL